MHDDYGLTYLYDGSFDGLLCCVFESYEKKEIPVDIQVAGSLQPLLFAGKSIVTDNQKARRVLTSIPKKIGPTAFRFIQNAFLSCLMQKELYILLFLRLGYQHGPSIMTMLTNDVVNKLFKAVRHIERESHLFKGFLRFSIINNNLIAEIEPKNFVLPLLAQHFKERYPEERFLIHDKTHGMGLIYQPYKAAVIPIQSLEIPLADEKEQFFQELWQVFYDTIAIKERYNPQCRMSHMPMRYWKYLTELSSRQRIPTISTIPSTDRKELTSPQNQPELYSNS